MKEQYCFLPGSQMALYLFFCRARLETKLETNYAGYEIDLNSHYSK